LLLENVISSEVSVGSKSFCLRLIERPTAVPNAIGMRIAMAGSEKSFAGRVRCGIYEVILLVLYEG
jgi:hypothetical protein